MEYIYMHTAHVGTKIKLTNFFFSLFFFVSAAVELPAVVVFAVQFQQMRVM